MADNQKNAELEDTVVVVEQNESITKNSHKLKSLLQKNLDEDLNSFSRVMLVAKIAEDDETILQRLPKDFKVLAKDFRLPITGLGVVQEEVFIGVFECFPDDLCTLVRRVSKLPIFNTMKILANSEDCPTRYFMPASFHSLRLSKEGDVDLESEFGDAATAAYAIYEKIMKAGQAMLKSNSNKFPSAHNNNIPSNSRCLAYLGHADFFSADDFVQTFDDPVHVVPLMDQMWPCQGDIPLS